MKDYSNKNIEYMDYMSKTIELQLDAIKHLDRLGLEELVEEQKSEFLPKWEKAFAKGREMLKSLDAGVSINIMADLYDMLSRTYDSETAEHLMGVLDSDIDFDNLKEISDKVIVYKAFVDSYQKIKDPSVA